VTALSHPTPSDWRRRKFIPIRCRRRTNAAASAMPAGD